MKKISSFFLITWLLMATHLQAALTLAGIFTDQAVLQREVAVPVWGWADPGAEIVVEFAGQRVTTSAGSGGKWIARLAAMAASAEPRVLKVTTGDQSLTRAEVLVGDVWLCSGQSNMAVSMSIPNPILRDAGPISRCTRPGHHGPMGTCHARNGEEMDSGGNPFWPPYSARNRCACRDSVFGAGRDTN